MHQKIKTLIAQGHEATALAGMISAGANLAETSGCFACHAMNEKVLGPPYQEVADRYKPRKDAVNYLTGKIINGSMGVWGEHAMPAQTQLSTADAEKMALYVLSLAGKKSKVNSLPSVGALAVNKHTGIGEGATYVLTVSYMDKGGEEIGPQRTHKSINLRSARIYPGEETVASITGKAEIRKEGKVSYADLEAGGVIGLVPLDYTGVEEISLRYATDLEGRSIEIRLGAPDGEVIAEVPMPPTGSLKTYKTVKMPVALGKGMQRLYFVGKTTAEEPVEGGKHFRLHWLYMNPPK